MGEIRVVDDAELELQCAYFPSNSTSKYPYVNDHLTRVSGSPIYYTAEGALNLYASGTTLDEFLYLTLPGTYDGSTEYSHDVVKHSFRLYVVPTDIITETMSGHIVYFYYLPGDTSKYVYVKIFYDDTPDGTVEIQIGTNDGILIQDATTFADLYEAFADRGWHLVDITIGRRYINVTFDESTTYTKDYIVDDDFTSRIFEIKHFAADYYSIVPIESDSYCKDFKVYSRESPNRNPSVTLSTPASGAVVSSSYEFAFTYDNEGDHQDNYVFKAIHGTAAIDANGYSKFQIQFATDEEFTNIVLDDTVEIQDVKQHGAGKYILNDTDISGLLYWRVKVWDFGLPHDYVSNPWHSNYLANILASEWTAPRPVKIIRPTVFDISDAIRSSYNTIQQDLFDGSHAYNAELESVIGSGVSLIAGALKITDDVHGVTMHIPGEENTHGTTFSHDSIRVTDKFMFDRLGAAEADKIYTVYLYSYNKSDSIVRIDYTLIKGGSSLDSIKVYDKDDDLIYTHELTLDEDETHTHVIEYSSGIVKMSLDGAYIFTVQIPDIISDTAANMRVSAVKFFQNNTAYSANWIIYEHKVETTLPLNRPPTISGSAPSPDVSRRGFNAADLFSGGFSYGASGDYWDVEKGTKAELMLMKSADDNHDAIISSEDDKEGVMTLLNLPVGYYFYRLRVMDSGHYLNANYPLGSDRMWSEWSPIGNINILDDTPTLTVSDNTVDVDEDILFTISNIETASEYMMSYGDGTESAWTTDKTFKYAYSKSGTFNAIGYYRTEDGVVQAHTDTEVITVSTINPTAIITATSKVIPVGIPVKISLENSVTGDDLYPLANYYFNLYKTAAESLIYTGTYLNKYPLVDDWIPDSYIYLVFDTPGYYRIRGKVRDSNSSSSSYTDYITIQVVAYSTTATALTFTKNVRSIAKTHESQYSSIHSSSRNLKLPYVKIKSKTTEMIDLEGRLFESTGIDDYNKLKGYVDNGTYISIAFIDKYGTTETKEGYLTNMSTTYEGGYTTEWEWRATLIVFDFNEYIEELLGINDFDEIYYLGKVPSDFYLYRNQMISLTNEGSLVISWPKSTYQNNDDEENVSIAYQRMNLYTKGFSTISYFNKPTLPSSDSYSTTKECNIGAAGKNVVIAYVSDDELGLSNSQTMKYVASSDRGSTFSAPVTVASGSSINLSSEGSRFGYFLYAKNVDGALTLYSTYDASTHTIVGSGFTGSNIQVCTLPIDWTAHPTFSAKGRMELVMVIYTASDGTIHSYNAFMDSLDSWTDSVLVSEGENNLMSGLLLRPEAFRNDAYSNMINNNIILVYGEFESLYSGYDATMYYSYISAITNLSTIVLTKKEIYDGSLMGLGLMTPVPSGYDYSLLALGSSYLDDDLLKNIYSISCLSSLELKDATESEKFSVKSFSGDAVYLQRRQASEIQNGRLYCFYTTHDDELFLVKMKQQDVVPHDLFFDDFYALDSTRWDVTGAPSAASTNESSIEITEPNSEQIIFHTNFSGNFNADESDILIRYKNTSGSNTVDTKYEFYDGSKKITLQMSIAKVLFLNNVQVSNILTATSYIDFRIKTTNGVSTLYLNGVVVSTTAPTENSSTTNRIVITAAASVNTCGVEIDYIGVGQYAD